jgi:hypothetical protein
MIFGDDEYLVITHRAADRLRALLRQPAMPEESARNVFLALIRDGEPVSAVRRRYGLIRRVRVASSCAGEVDLFLSYGLDPEGRPILAPDGRKRVVFATDLLPAGGAG